jgi:hypothetical protein
MDHFGKSVQRVTHSSKDLTQASTEQHRKNTLAAQRTKLMLDCYRTGAANNPETFVTAIAATLARYPDEVIYRVTDPRSGIQSRIAWMPSIKEVRDECERAMEPIQQRMEQEKRIAEQLAERERLEQLRASRPSLDDMKSKYGDTWGIGVQTAKQKAAEPAPNVDQLRHHYVHYDLAFRPKQSGDVA